MNTRNTVDPRAFRDACGEFATGVTVVSTRSEDAISGMTANAFMSISLDPPLIAVSLGLNARTLGVIRSAGRFAVAILPAAAEHVAWHFAGRPQQGLTEPFEMLDDLPVATGAAAAFATTIEMDLPAGDHAILVGRITAMKHACEASPLLFHRGKFGRIAQEHSGPLSQERLNEHMWWGFGGR